MGRKPRRDGDGIREDGGGRYVFQVGDGGSPEVQGPGPGDRQGFEPGRILEARALAGIDRCGPKLRTVGRSHRVKNPPLGVRALGEQGDRPLRAVIWIDSAQVQGFQAASAEFDAAAEPVRRGRVF